MPGPPDTHAPVLLAEVTAALAPRPGDTIVDCTAGLGGHAAALVASTAVAAGPARGVTVVLLDLDPGNLARAADRVRGVGGGGGVVAVHAHHASFVEAPRLLGSAGLAADVLLADLGFASNQMFDPARGLSFSVDGPLDMRLNPAAPITAAELVNSLTERELADLIVRYGEEPPPRARTIARNLVRARRDGPISTTHRFAEIIRDSYPARERYSGSIDPATRTFQAFRIAVNDELSSLDSLLSSIDLAARRIAQHQPTWLRPGARIGIITFHSLEDRPVKRSFLSLVERGLAVHLTRKPVQASEAELAVNPRARSAQFRAIRMVSPSMRE